MSHESLPVVIIGAGPVALAAAVYALSRDLRPLVFESGPRVGDGIRKWAHVRMFSPWKYAVDRASAALLAQDGWIRPADGEYPTGRDIVERYLEPLAATPALAPHIRVNTTVVSVSRRHRDKMKDAERQAAPFVVRVRTASGEEDVLARAVIDASGTMNTPGWLGASGLPAIGEREAAARIFYGIPDVRNAHRERYAGRRVLVVGSGHSALNALLDLAALAIEVPETAIAWAVRRPALGQLLGGARPDQLEERGKLGQRVQRLLANAQLALVTGFHIGRVTTTRDGLVVSDGDRALPAVDEVVAATGFRPDWSLLSELRLDLDAAVEAPRALAPLIDPNIHSCGTVPPHGAEELKHPDTNLFIAGMKSYGRAPTFLLITGYEQVRSIVSAIAGDWEAARRVELVLPDTGVCSTDQSGAESGACCGSTAEAVSVTLGTLARPKVTIE